MDLKEDMFLLKTTAKKDSTLPQLSGRQGRCERCGDDVVVGGGGKNVGYQSKGT
jgi:hypothetical protein